ncbi:hypothetical protein [uncultured Sphingomonas sp.]|uniref:hypothetical protein n=1 Tax=uncultured Sphingomonas sp. TaxID=158754 RepID=UPI0035CBBEC8
MRLLLLLSALFAALTGAGASARPPGIQAVAASASAVTPTRVRAHAHVLLATRPVGTKVAEPEPAAHSEPRAAPARLWASRRRE